MTTWAGVTVGPEDSFDGIWLHMAAAEPSTCRITASRAAVDAGLCHPAIPARSPALVHDGSLAYLALRRLDTTPPSFELGATGHGPAGPDMARRICACVAAWNRDRDAQPTITLRPADESSHQGPPAGAVKQWTQLITTF